MKKIFMLFLIISSFQIYAEEPHYKVHNKKHIKKLFSFLEKFDPGRLRELQVLKQKNKREFLEVLRCSFIEMREMEHLKKHNPKRYQKLVMYKTWKAKIHKLVGLYKREKNPKEKAELKATLRKALTKVFEFKVQEYQREIKNLSRELEKLKRRAHKAIKHKDQLIDKKLNELLGESEEFEW